VTKTSQKNIWIAYILAFLFGGAGLLYLGRGEDRQLGVVLTIITILCWTTIILEIFPGLVGLYLTYKAAQEMGLTGSNEI
jgi:hypothetical protein